MSHLALRRVMIRLLHDSAFAAEVYTDAERALGGVDLSATERGWLTMQPPAAWRTDAARPARVLAALGEEFPAAVTLATVHAAGFLRSPHFHGAIQERGSLALAFGEYLGLAPDSRARALARLEWAIAAVRRATARSGAAPARGLRLSAHAVVVRVPRGALALLDAVRTGASGGALGPGQEIVLVAGTPGGEVGLEALEPALAAVLERAADGCTREELLAEARRQGAEPGEDAEIVARLLADGLLVVGDQRSPV